MQVKNALILAAGFGTRMGEIGKIRPKVTWPIFERTLLELQVLWAKKLGVKKIFINTHFQSHEIRTLYQGNPVFDGVEWLHEPVILDVGGAIHNVARQPLIQYQGHLLVLNADLFLEMTKEDIDKHLSQDSSWTTCLFVKKVNSSQGYNETKIEEGYFKEVIPNSTLPRNQSIFTYTGVCVVNLSQLKPVDGVSPFFQSVCDPLHGKHLAVDKSQSEYWDFGTSKRYYESMFELLSKKDSFFEKFLLECSGIIDGHIDRLRLSYRSKDDKVINLSPWVNLYSGLKNTIILSTPKKMPNSFANQESLIYGDVVVTQLL